MSAADTAYAEHHEVESVHLLEMFRWEHLPEHLQAASKPFAELAGQLCLDLPPNQMRTMALWKLLEAKDCAVRARLKSTESKPVKTDGIYREGWRPSELEGLVHGHALVVRTYQVQYVQESPSETWVQRTFQARSLDEAIRMTMAPVLTQARASFVSSGTTMVRIVAEGVLMERLAIRWTLPPFPGDYVSGDDLPRVILMLVPYVFDEASGTFKSGMAKDGALREWPDGYTADCPTVVETYA